jgi:hypothetical protein
LDHAFGHGVGGLAVLGLGDRSQSWQGGEGDKRKAGNSHSAVWVWDWNSFCDHANQRQAAILVAASDPEGAKEFDGKLGILKSLRKQRMIAGRSYRFPLKKKCAGLNCF